MPVTILKGFSESGVTLHKLSEKIDEGDILLQGHFKVEQNENLESFMGKVNQLISQLIPKLMKHFYVFYKNAKPQEEGEYWREPKEEDWTIVPEMEEETIDRILRAFYGYECIWKENGKRMELIRGRLVTEYPDSDRYFVTKNNSYVIAEQIVMLGDEEKECSLCHPVCVGTPNFLHKEKVEQLRKTYHHELSSHAFSFLYLWRRAMRLTLYLGKGLFSVRCGWKGKNAWFFPCGNEKEILDFINYHIEESDFLLCYLRRKDVDFLKRYFGENFEFYRTEDADEYIYEKEGHRNLSGKLYANVRAQLHKAKREHTLKVEPIKEENLPVAYKILKEWEETEHFSKKESIDGGLNLKSWEEKEVLQNFRQLDITGILVYVEEEAYAVVAGYPLNEDTYDLFLAKEKKRISGLGYFSKREFFLSLPKQYQYLNIEEDFGIEGLRRMKQLLVPVRMNEIWEAIRCKEQIVKKETCLPKEYFVDCGEHL